MALPLLFVAHGDRAQGWVEVIRRSRQIELLAVIDLAAGGVDGIDAMLTSRPDAAVAVWSAGPREASRLAERLVEHAGPCLLHPAPARPPLGSGVQLTHGWLSLSGIGALERLFSSPSVESVRLSVRGLPEGPSPGLAPALYQAMTLVQRLGRDVAVQRAVLTNEQELSLRLAVDEVPWMVDVSSRGHALQLTVRTGEGDYSWTVDSVSESLRRARAEPRVVPATPWAERCVNLLLTPQRGGDLQDARAARSLVDAVELSLERRLPPDWVRAVDPRLGIGALGLSGELPDAAPLAPTAPPSHELPFEALAYALELRPAVSLTVTPQDEARVRAALPGVILRRERRARASHASAWADDAAIGEPRVVLFAARDASAAERLATIEAEDSTDRRSARGALLGYPACCVQAFEAQGGRGDPSHRGDPSENPVAIAARTAIGPGPWPALLDDTSLKLLPHCPCTYRCERSHRQVEDLLDALRDEDAELRRRLLRFLGGPVLYFDHRHQLRFDGEVSDGMAVRYRAVSMPWSPSESFARLAGAVALGDRLVLTEGGLSVYAEDERLFALERTDPGLGVLLPFAPRQAPD